MPARDKPRRPGAPWLIDEIAEEGRFSRQLLYALVQKGELASIRVGNSIRVPDWQARALLGLTSDNDTNAAA